MSSWLKAPELSRKGWFDAALKTPNSAGFSDRLSKNPIGTFYDLAMGYSK